MSALRNSQPDHPDRRRLRTAKPKRGPAQRPLVKSPKRSRAEREARAEELLQVAQAAEPARGSLERSLVVPKADLADICERLRILWIVASACAQVAELDAKGAVCKRLQNCIADELGHQWSRLDDIRRRCAVSM
jgi:hypothetical protein